MESTCNTRFHTVIATWSTEDSLLCTMLFNIYDTIFSWSETAMSCSRGPTAHCSVRLWLQVWSNAFLQPTQWYTSLIFHLINRYVMLATHLWGIYYNAFYCLLCFDTVPHVIELVYLRMRESPRKTIRVFSRHWLSMDLDRSKYRANSQFSGFHRVGSLRWSDTHRSRCVWSLWYSHAQVKVRRGWLLQYEGLVNFGRFK